MIVLIAPEKDIENEVEILHRLFDAGLQFYHFRKPYKNYEEHVRYLNLIDQKYHSRIVVHYFHELLEDYKLKGIHLQEQPRIDLKERLISYVNSYKEKGCTVSSSFHEPEVLDACEVKFDYNLLSPVFSSISKKGYEGKGFDVRHINKTVVGMGGVNSKTIGKIKLLGYKGVGVLGGVWNSENPIESFKAIQRQYEIEKSTKN
ncbi:Thiamine-phosphate pyrophosphorylase [Tenacibaculum sp. 190130A14a]|uniref:Thiamine-phosphate pyrophosphorylase n=1 Tax=Tenacibaculum polynesiense TaxID=3137857 RepID=A0ABP1ETQ5_9FLAO